MSNGSVFPVGNAEYDAVYAQEAAMIDAAELIARALEASGLSRADLARRLGVSRAEVTARLKGERNITVRTLAETLHVLGETLKIESERSEQRTRTRTRTQEWRFAERAHGSPSRSGWIHPGVAHVR